MNIDAITLYLKSLSVPDFRSKQLLNAINQGVISWQDVVVWPKILRDMCEKNGSFVTWIKNEVIISDDGTKKAILTLNDHRVIETVLMEPKPGHWSVCLSSEVGCPMNCAFCATGSLGFTRKLTSEEITDQYLFWLSFIRKSNFINRISSVVFMGMGEPFHNKKEVFAAIVAINTHYGIGSRHISVSTCGIPEGIDDLGINFPQVNLAISLHSANDSTRSKLMPINKKTTLNVLKNTIKTYLARTGRQVMFEYLLIDDINDREIDREELIAWLKDLPINLIHINLIRYNQTYLGFTPSSINMVTKWRAILEKRGISASVRKNLGQDIDGACGQLASKSIPIL
jgi:adenine C2-methylase RlmN of 23S rRNA A2503 and tRNA A37